MVKICYAYNRTVRRDYPSRERKKMDSISSRQGPLEEKPSSSHNKAGWLVIAAIAAVIIAAAMFGCPAEASAQTLNAPAVRIADAAQPTILLMEAAMKCAESKDKDTRKFCLRLVELEVNRGAKVANEAADATKNNWPKPVVVSPYGYGYGGVNTTGGWVVPYRRPIVCGARGYCFGQ